MQRPAVKVAFTLLWLLVLKIQDVIGSGHFCLRSSPAEDGLTRVTFLRQKAGVRALYLTVWSEDLRLVSCEVNTNPLVTESYGSLCKSSSGQAQEVNERFNISAILSPDAPCTLDASSAQKFTERAEGEGKVRRKRSWLFPGTLWCGHGNHAGGYHQLGMFEDADRCCREHDHCNHIIPGMTVNYGIFNPNFYTVSHCDCDQRFRRCLLGVNDTIARVVGYSFFNILQIPCFELKHQMQCTEMYWWGKCKVTKEAAYATFKNSLPFNASQVESDYEDKTDRNNTTSSEGHHVTESPVTNATRKLPKDERRCVTRDVLRGDTFSNKRGKGKGCKRRQKWSTVAPSQWPRVSTLNTTTPSTTTGVPNATKSIPFILNENRHVKKKGLSAYPTVKAHSEITTASHPQTASATQPPPLLSQSTALQHFTAVTARTESTKSRKKFPKQKQCCGSTVPVRGDTLIPRCKRCPEQNITTQATTATPATTTNEFHFKTTTTLRQTRKTQSPKRDTSKRLRSTATPGTSGNGNATELKTAAHHYDDKTQKQVYSHLLGNNASQQLKTLQHNHASSDDLLLCQSFKHLDKCKYKIPPLEKKYDLQNVEAKTAYHCYCTSRLAGHIQSFRQPFTLPPFLMDSVSQYCFKLPKKKKCHHRKSCSGGFTKAFDLLQALKKIEGKDIAGVQNSGTDRKRRISVRLYKRCLRLRREAATMAQLT